MSWWTPSWLPTLPSLDFSLPSGIQKRFLSFALRQALGHLLKPGQLDTQQVDSQIGSGFVQIRDVELDNDVRSHIVSADRVLNRGQAINALIAGLPIQLHDGSVGKVTARIPWPNPLTSAVGLSLESLHLTFILEPTVSLNRRPPTAADVAESVASVAETFLHDELDSQEEAELFGSFHPELAASVESVDHVPGGLDPFLGEGEGRGEHDPPGVSIFATLVERLLSRFQFDATDIKITLVHPEHASFTVSVPAIRYSSELAEDYAKNAQHDPSAGEAQAQPPSGATRTVSVTGITVTTRCLRPPSPEPMLSSTTSTASYHPHTINTSPTSSLPPSPLSDSDIDEETTMLMSQSLAGLPPRPISPSSSVSSSMYQSAISNASMAYSRAPPFDVERPTSPPPESSNASRPLQTGNPRSSVPPRLGIITQEIEDEMLLSLGTEPIVVRLLTPTPARKSKPRKSHSEEQTSSSTEPAKVRVSSQSAVETEAMKLEVSIGVVAIGLRARHIRSILDVANLWSTHTPEPQAPVEPKEIASSRPLAEHVDVNLRLKGLVLVLLPTPNDKLLNASSEFFRHPLVPPNLTHGYARLHLDDLSASLSMRPTPGPSSLRRAIPGFSGSTITATASLSELSAFAFLRGSKSTIDGLRAVPLLITDPNLSSHYDVSHIHPDLRQPDGDVDLPAFDIVDWTDEANWTSSAKLSLWRTKLPQARPTSTAGNELGQSPRNTGQSYSPSSSPRVSAGTSPRRTAQVHAPISRSAVVVKLTMSTAPPKQQSRRKGKEPATGVTVDVDIAPLHIFADLSAVLGAEGEPTGVSETMRFLDEVSVSDITPASTGLAGDSGDVQDEDDDAETPPATPRARQNFFQQQHELDRERERKRLEKLVMEDLDLEYDYSQATSERKKDVKTHRRKQSSGAHSTTRISCNFPTIRLELRAAQLSSGKARSGSLVIDLHDVCLSTGQAPQQESGGVHFAGMEDPLSPVDLTRHQDAAPLITAQWSRLVVAYCAVGESHAKSILSLGPLPPVDRSKPQVHTGSPVPRSTPLIQQTKPHIVVSQSTSGERSTLILAVEIPSVYVKLAKAEVDGLQIWADELSKLAEASNSSKASSQQTSRDASLIGSRYFSRSQRNDSNESSMSGSSAQPSSATKETVVKVSVTEAAVVVVLPRQNVDSPSTRPFKIMASDVDVLLELKPEGKDETVVTLGVTDLNIAETSPNGASLTFLSLTMPRSVIEPSQSLLKVRFKSFVVAGTTAKESRVKVTLCGVTYTVHPDLQWLNDLAAFAKAPPGVFEDVPPSERTHVSVKVIDTSVRALCPTFPGALVLHIGETEFSTTLIGNIPEMSFHLSIQTVALFLIDDLTSSSEADITSGHLAGMGRLSRAGGGVWRALGYALLVELSNFDLKFHKLDYVAPPDVRILVERGNLRLHLAADTATALGGFIGDFSTLFASKPEPGVAPVKPKREPTDVSKLAASQRDLMASLDDQAFRRRIPEVGAAPDMVEDDLPSNLDYLDDSFSATAGLRALDDDEFEDEFTPDESGYSPVTDQTGVISVYGGETIRLLDPAGLHIVEHHFDTLPPDAADESSLYGETTLKVRVDNCDVTVFLYDGYDWARTRRIIEEKAKEMRRRLARIRQLVANGQTPDPSVEETNTLLFNSVYIGIEHNIDEVEPAALMAEIDEELNEGSETASQSSWQSFKPQHFSPGSPRSTDQETRKARRKLTRSRGPCIEFRLQGLSAEVDNYRSHPSTASRTLATIVDLEILDHIKTSTWSKFLTSLRTDSRGNIRETDSNMVRVELRQVYPVAGNPAEESRLRAKILPLRLHVDQDALDFLKKFFSFKDPEAVPSEGTESTDNTFFQHVEVFPVDLKLDYKPRRVDYRALRDGKTIELMNFFHFDGAEMTLRHITLTGITGWAKVGDLLNDLWTPDVKATQLVEVISGVAPIRSVVNVGSGVADLVLLPISQYKKDGRVVRGLQKGTTAFVKSTATEAVKLGARLATGTQVILEQAEHVIGGQFTDPITAEALQLPAGYRDLEAGGDDDIDPEELFSRYADQPTGVKEGVVSAYRSLKRNLNSAAQTILAVPMEVYERSGNEGAVRAVVRAVPIAVLKPMIGASEAVSKTLLGLHNTLDPNVRIENEAKYKQR